VWTNLKRTIKLLNGIQKSSFQPYIFFADCHSDLRYVREKRARQLQDCEEKIEEFQVLIHDLRNTIERVREDIADIEKEINESGASVANLRENIRVRKLKRDIAATQAKIDSFDMEEAARSRQMFEAKYNIEKKKETELQGKVRGHGSLVFHYGIQICHSPSSHIWRENSVRIKPG
jgi:DNA repair exonuclease SbcCD ATPase subunit